MINPAPKSAYLTVRTTQDTRTKFYEKCQKYGAPSDILRELVDAFVENRVVITPPVTRKESLYVTGS